MAPSFTFFLFFILFLVHAQAQTVQTFTYTNEGEFGPYITENDATYRTLPIGTSPFQLCFYNITPNAFYLALRMGTSRSESTRRWVWQANPFRPVGENATFSLIADGNLVLTESNGQTVWSTGTANKGVVGLKVLPNGNVVLYDARGRFVWQSFDYPVDTLLVGQFLRRNGRPSKLVSKSGVYSLVLESGGLSMYINNAAAGAKPFKYGMLGETPPLDSVHFKCEPETEDAFAYELTLDLGANRGSEILARPKYNATLSFLRLEEDGNLVVYTYYDPVDYRAWEKTFAFFSYEIGRAGLCELPSKCGALGVCEDEMCVACPSRQGLLGWSENCATPGLGNCEGGKGVEYYKVVGVGNFLTSYGRGEGRVKVEECKRRCSLDCKCVGFMYWELEAKCWLAPVIGTLNSVSNSSQVAYIKYPK